MNDHKNNRSNLDVNMNFTDNDKEEICNIIKSMSKEHHMYIYFNILHNLEKSISAPMSEIRNTHI